MYALSVLISNFLYFIFLLCYVAAFNCFKWHFNNFEMLDFNKFSKGIAVCAHSINHQLMGLKQAQLLRN